MAETTEKTEKKYLDLAGLGKYDAKIKEVIDAKDAAGLADAKAYADSLGDNYDPAGSAATAKAAADAAQADVDALEALVGVLPEGVDAKTIVEYVKEKTAGIATDTALAELQAGLDDVEADVAAIVADYLKAADKEAIQANIDEIAAKVTKLIGTDADKSVRTIAAEELAKQLIPEDAQESLDTLQEIAAWIQAHPDDAAAINASIDAVKTQIGNIPEGATAKTIVDYITEAVAVEKARAEAAEAGIADRVTAVEAKFGEGEGGVKDMIADAIDPVKTKVEAVETDVADLKTKAHTHENKSILDAIDMTKVSNWDTALDQAKEYTDGKIAEFSRITEEEINALFK